MPSIAGAQLTPACLPSPPPLVQVRGGKAARSGGGVGMTPGRSPAYGMLASPHPNRGGGMQQNVMASPNRQSGPGGGGGGGGGAGMYSGRVSTQQVGGGMV